MIDEFITIHKKHKDMKYDIFISYRRTGGKDKARSLKLELERRGYHVFLDFDDLKDSVFDKRIIGAIDEAPIFIIILSKNSLDNCKDDNDWVRKEIEYAISKDKHIIPVNPDKEFKDFPDDVPDNIKQHIGQHQFSTIDFEQLFQESMNKMVRDRIEPEFAHKSSKKWIYIILFLAVLAASVFGYTYMVNNKILREDIAEYIRIVREADSLYAIMKFEESVGLYEEARKYEDKYISTKYANDFNEQVQNKIDEAEIKIEEEKKKAEEEKLAKERQAMEEMIKENEKITQKSEAAKAKKATIINGHECVDLGLSVRWAKYNIGVITYKLTEADDYYGDYFCWGAITNDDTYNNGTKSIVNTEYDAAKANWGNGWMMPTKEQMIELVNNCTWKWVNDYNGIHNLNGYIVRSRKKGYTDKYIFLPASGYREKDSLNKEGDYGFYWSSTPNTSKTNYAYSLDFFSSIYYVIDYARAKAVSIRPVCK